MLNGIEVLNKIELCNEVFNPTSVIFFILTIISIVIEFWSGVNEYIIMFIIGVVSLMIFFSVALIIVTKQVPNGKYEYQVTISDSVSMVEFTSKYDIIRVDGEIYTIREKERE